jgi:hypothetical protein
MERELKDIQGSQNLKVIKKALPTNIDAQAMFDSNNNPIWEVRISSARGNNFFTRPVSRQQASIFHEASHYVGTEDQDVPDTEDAHSLENLFTAEHFSFRNWEYVVADKFGMLPGCCKKQPNQSK